MPYFPHMKYDALAEVRQKTYGQSASKASKKPTLTYTTIGFGRPTAVHLIGAFAWSNF
jgi:hypothetical protein